jgi:hypothetical protein
VEAGGRFGIAVAIEISPDETSDASGSADVGKADVGGQAYRLRAVVRLRFCGQGKVGGCC